MKTAFSSVDRHVNQLTVPNLPTESLIIVDDCDFKEHTTCFDEFHGMFQTATIYPYAQANLTLARQPKALLHIVQCV